MAFVASWGIIGCGWISSMFVKDLAFTKDDVTDVTHEIVAVGSRDIVKAEKFIANECPKGARGQISGVRQTVPQAYGSYDEVYNHPDVNIIYIGTLHPSHYLDTKAALEAGKNVLVEKPACLNAAEWASLSSIAKQKGLFLMEGMWTRFQPLYKALEEKLHKEKIIGDVKHVKGDFSMPFYNNVPDSHRTLALEAAGGPMYDLGAYSMLPAMLALYKDPANEKTKPNVSAMMTKSRTGGDLSTTILLGFDTLGATAVCSSSFAYGSPREERCVIIGTEGEIVLHDGLSRITKMTIRQTVPGGTFYAPQWKDEVTIELPIEGFGLHYEADAVARSLRDGDLESSIMPHEDTALTMEIFDEVRRIGGYILPEGMEQLK